MLKKLIAAGAASAVLTQSAHAANFAVITSAPNLLNLAVLIAAVVGVVGGVRVLSLVKGGTLARTWQVFVLALGVLIITQMAQLGHQVELFSLPTFAVPALLVVSVGLFVYGIFETKRVLG